MVESLSCGTGWPTRKRALRRSPLDSWTHVPVLVTHVAVLVLGLAWIAACGGDAPRKPQPDAPAAATAPATPPDGRARIALPARDTSTYRIVASVEGEAEVQPILADPDGGSWRRQRASSDTELVYHALPAPHAPEGEIGAALVLDALRHRTIRRDDTGATLQTELELAEDRLRLSQDDKVTSDLRGAQPQEGLTPRMLLARPFALLREDLEGRVITIAPQGILQAKRFLRPLELRPMIEASRLPRPTSPAGAGASWSGRIFPVSPAGRLGLRLDVTFELAGFERLDGHACAWIVMRGGREGAVSGETGIPFERVVAKVEGQAWVDLATARVRRYVVEEEVRAAYERSSGTRGTRHRARHRARVEFELLDPAPEQRGAAWADGTQRFRRL